MPICQTRDVYAPTTPLQFSKVLMIIRRIKLVTPCAMLFYGGENDALCVDSSDGTSFQLPLELSYMDCWRGAW